MIIRPATIDDLPAVDLIQKANSRDVGFLPTVALANRAANNTLFVAEADTGTLAGYILGSKRQTPAVQAKVFQVAVGEGGRGHGLGRRLLSAFLNAPPAADVAACWVGQDMPATAFWTAVGFLPIAVRRGSARGHDIHVLFQWTRDGRPRPDLIPTKAVGGPFSAREVRAVLPLVAGQDWAAVRPDDAGLVRAQALLPARRPRVAPKPTGPPPLAYPFVRVAGFVTVRIGGKWIHRAHRSFAQSASAG